MMSNNSFPWRRLGAVFLFLSLALILAGAFWTTAVQSAEPGTIYLDDPDGNTPAVTTPSPESTVEDGKPQTGLPEAHMAVGPKLYQIEVATTPEQSEKGLMYRTSLPQGHGMLFTFNPPRPVSFWMKNTKIPLDILFIANGKLLHAFQDAQPCLSDPCQTYGIRAMVDMVLELPAGTARRDRLVVGMPVQLRWPTPGKSTPSTGK